MTQTIILWGTGSASRERNPWWLWKFLNFGMFVALLGSFIYSIHALRTGAKFSWLTLVPIYVSIGMTYGRRWLQKRPAFSKPPQPMQARFSAAGFGLRYGFGPVVLRSWDRRRLKAHILQRYGCCVITDGRIFGSIFMFKFKATPEQITEVVARIESLATAHGATFSRYPEHRIY